MSKSSLPEDEALSPALRRRIDQACNRFEAAQRGGAPLPIEDLLDGWKEPDRSTLLRELVLLDLDYRRARGERCRVEDYKPFPTLDPAWLADALADDAPPLPGGTVTAAPGETVVAVAAGQTFGDFEILEEIGRGGMGVVYKARQVSLKRVVALKMILSGEHAGPAELARFRAEARAIAQLQHPNIVQIHEVGEHGGRSFFALEFCPGGNLDRKLHGTPLPAKEAARLVEVLARAMHAAHQKEIVHRDLKPANVLLAADGTVKITDFGLAKKLDEAGATQSGAVMGTPSYMAPEQADGKPKEIGPAADVYALGAILYEGLTGRPPFKAATVLETLKQVLQDDPVPPRQLQPKTPRDLETICLKCLRKEPAKRYADAEALAKDLERFLAGKPIEARPVSAAERGVKWVRRNPAWTALTGVTALALLTVTVGGVWFAFRLRKDNDDLTAALKSQGEAEKGEKEKLYRSYVSEAEARRFSRRMGQRFEALEAIRNAVDLLGKLEWSEEKRQQETDKLRNLAIACLALPDVRVIREWDGWPEGSFALAVEDTLRWYAREDKQGNVSVRRIKDDEEVGRWTGGDGQTYSLTFAPEGRFLLLRRDHQIWGWRPSEKEAFVTIQVDAVVCGVRIRPDGKQAAVVGQDGRVNLYTLPEGRRERSLRIPEWNVPNGEDLHVLDYSPDGRQLAVGGGGYGEPGCRNIFVYSLDSESAPTLLSHDDYVHSVAWDPDGKTLAAGCWNNNNIYTWDVSGRKVLGMNKRQRGGAPSLAVNRTGELLASTSDWGEGARFWHNQTGSELLQVPDCKADFHPAADGRLFAAQIEDQRIRLLECVAGRECRTLARDLRAERGDDQYTLPALSPDDRLLAVATPSGVGIWDTSTGREQAFLAIGGTQPVGFEPSGALLTYGDAGLNRWPIEADPARADFLRVGPPHPLLDLSWHGSPRLCGLSQDRRVIAVPLSNGNGAWVFCVDDPQRKLWVGPHSDVRRVAVSPDGGLVATASWNVMQGVKVWDARTGRQVGPDLLPKHHIDWMTFSPDGKWLVAESSRTAVNSLQSNWYAVDSWHPRSQDETRPAHSFSSDGKLFAGPGEGATLLLFDSASGRQLAVLEGPSQGGVSPAFNRDGTVLVASDADNPQVWVWDLRLIRSELADLHLDWDPTPYPPPAEAVASTVKTIQVDLGVVLVPRLYNQHLTQGRKDSDAGRWGEAVAEFSRAIDLRDTDPTAWWERAHNRGRLGQWDRAKSDDARAVAINPVGMPAILYQYAGACVQANDLPGCREVCRRLLNRPDPADSLDCFWVARACVLAPDAVADWQRPVHLAEKGAAGEATPWRLYVLAAAKYRAGRYGETVCLCGKSMGAGPWQAVCLDYVLLAMAHGRLGDKDKARYWLDKATREIAEAEKARRERGDDKPIPAFAAYCDWLDYQILRREAEALLADK